jgi:predicted CXXCH cytochrome family protein
MTAGSSPSGWVIGLAGVGIVVVVSAAVLFVGIPSPPVPQPIAFNHLKHTQDLGLPCSFCHRYVETGAHAGLPDEQTCATCHLNPQGTSEEAAKVTELLTAGKPIRFNKLFRLPPDVFYTHRRHVGIAKLECTNCHGAIAESERPPKRALVKVDMDFCLDCHAERGQSEDCNSCHR